MYSRFVEQLKKRLKMPLPGEGAQFLMAPKGRNRAQNVDIGLLIPVKSAVLIILYPKGNSVNTLLIERPVYDGVHSGQAAFPGGKLEKADVDLKHTALRETLEEIGISSNEITVIGQLTDLYIPRSNFLVSPFIGCMDKQPEFIINSYEVQRIIAVDLFSLSDERIVAEKEIIHSSGYKIEAPCYEIEDLSVWGATAMMISELNVVVREALKDDMK